MEYKSCEWPWEQSGQPTKGPSVQQLSPGAQLTRLISHRPTGSLTPPPIAATRGGWDQSATVHLSNPQKRTANPFSPTLSDICPASLSARLSSIALDLLAPGLTEPLRISSFPSFSSFFYSSFPHLHINKSAARKGCAVGGLLLFCLPDCTSVGILYIHAVL